MLKQIADAIERRDYRTAAQLLKVVLKQSPHDPWAQLYAARLQEVAGKSEAAETIYRQLLRDVANPKLASQARQGLQRLEAAVAERRQQALAEASAHPDQHHPGFMILEAATGEQRPAIVQGFARVMQLDLYTARGLVPSHGWRLYRAGTMGELTVYGQELQQAGVPVFWASLPEIEQIQVFQVRYFQSVAPEVTVVCENESGQLGSLTFTWAELTQQVEGMLPLYSQIVDVGYRNQLERREEAEDYARFCDLHLPHRRSILRMHDGSYDFQHGVSVQVSDRLESATIRRNWNRLLAFIHQQTPAATRWADFTTFAESAQDFTVPLSRLTAHIRLPRPNETYFDPAFHLYSALAFLKG